MGSSIIEMGLGLVLVFMVMSLLVSQINNILKNALNVRGDTFRRELERLLQDPAIREQVFEHPGVQRLFEASSGSDVHNITAETLAVTLIDVLAGSGEVLETLENLENTPLVNLLLESITDQRLRATLHTILTTARNLAAARHKIAEWFDTAMSTASAVYARRMQLISALTGLVLALLLNVDTIYLAQAFWNDPVLRQATVEAANTALAEIDPNATSEDLVESVHQAQETVDTLLELRLPIGWYAQPVDDNTLAVGGVNPSSDTRNLWNLWPGNNPNWVGLLLLKVLGIALTTIAVMQGAPFWFDLLRRVGGG
ncbi:MAG: hypothetical protein JW910_00490 [Anaerolineae bacterium]|nr:hypothetical protein [Anaerolineae bacterium]